MKKVDIILLDEVTSALDNESKDRMLETILKLKKNHTIVFGTHDKSIEKLCDRVITL